MSPLLQALFGVLAVLGALSGGYFAYLGLRRQRSGTVATSQADDLWAALEKYTNNLKGDNDELRAEVRQVRARMAHVENEWDECKVQCQTVKRLVAECQQREDTMVRKLREAGIELD